MSQTNTTIPTRPARSHAEAAALFRRPFAPGAIGFRAMTKVPYHGIQYAGAQVAAYLGAQSVVQRLNAVVPGRWRQQFHAIPGELAGGEKRMLYLSYRLIVTLPVEAGGPDTEAVLGHLDAMGAPDHAGWQQRGLVDGVRQRFHIPMTILEIDRSGHVPAPNLG
jgi:hypothetical protein